MSGKGTKSVKSVETALRVIEALRDHDGAGVTQLAGELDQPNSTIHNHLKTLERNEYIVNEGGTYRIGTRFLKLGARTLDHHPIYEVARPEVDSLAEDTGELSGLIIEEHGRGVFLYRAKGEQAVHVDTYPGKRIYLHGAALGKALLSALPESRVDEILDRHGLPALTENTITNPDALYEELAEIRDAGVAFDDEERLNGLRSVAAPVTTD